MNEYTDEDVNGIIDNDRSSIEVSQNAAGKYAKRVKIYFNANTMKPADVIKEVTAAYVILNKTFK